MDSRTRARTRRCLLRRRVMDTKTEHIRNDTRESWTHLHRLHGKGGVDGSSPSEGFEFLLLRWGVTPDLPDSAGGRTDLTPLIPGKAVASGHDDRELAL